MENAVEKINKFTRREFTEDELYIFPVVLCDNDIDRDCECFSENALETLKDMFIGKTGIFDHNAKSSNQNARIYDTETVTDSTRKTKDGRDYTCLRGYAYMVRTDENKNLIAEIDGGIKKEVSISCSVSGKKCSVCGCDKNMESCTHVKGHIYGGKLCCTVLDDVSDAYEWSFVAVPAQVNAGVTKKFTEEDSKIADSGEISLISRTELIKDIRRLAFLSGGKTVSDSAVISAEKLSFSKLVEMKKEYERICAKADTKIQIIPENNRGEYEDFKI